MNTKDQIDEFLISKKMEIEENKRNRILSGRISPAYIYPAIVFMIVGSTILEKTTSLGALLIALGPILLLKGIISDLNERMRLLLEEVDKKN